MLSSKPKNIKSINHYSKLKALLENSAKSSEIMCHSGGSRRFCLQTHGFIEKLTKVIAQRQIYK